MIKNIINIISIFVGIFVFGLAFMVVGLSDKGAYYKPSAGEFWFYQIVAASIMALALLFGYLLKINKNKKPCEHKDENGKSTMDLVEYGAFRQGLKCRLCGKMD
ncbi:MAG: hypothetical protein AABY15_01650 [Nanoarchaeota archaeon]